MSHSGGRAGAELWWAAGNREHVELQRAKRALPAPAAVCLAALCLGGFAKLPAQEEPAGGPGAADDAAAATAEPAAESPVPRLDRVILKDGSIILGEVQGMTEGKLTIKSAFAIDEKITVRWADVAALETHKPLPFVLADGTRVQGTVRPGPEGKILIASADIAEASTVSLTAVTAINPPEKKAIAYSGSINFGGSVADGNTQTRSASLRAEFLARSENVNAVGLRF